MLEEKEMWDIVNKTRLEAITIPQTMKRDKDNTIFSKIIKQGVNSDLCINIIGKCDLHQFWENLWQVYF